MKKSDLKSGMVVKFRYWNRLCMLIDNVFCEVDGSGFVNLSSYDEDMCNINDGNQWDVVEVYKCKYPNFMSCFIEDKLELIWKREKEIDWLKVPFGAKVLVYDYAGDTKLEVRLLSYSKDSEIPFKVFVEASNECYTFRHCELIEESKEEKEVTYKEVYADYDEYCKNYECTNCKYRKNGDGDCTIAYILNNYNITRK